MIVLAKGVVFSLVSVIFFMPTLMLAMMKHFKKRLTDRSSLLLKGWARLLQSMRSGF